MCIVLYVLYSVCYSVCRDPEIVYLRVCLIECVSWRGCIKECGLQKMYCRVYKRVCATECVLYTV